MTHRAHVSLPESLRAIVNQRMIALGCGEFSEYVRHLIRNDCFPSGGRLLGARTEGAVRDA